MRFSAHSSGCELARARLLQWEMHTWSHLSPDLGFLLPSAAEERTPRAGLGEHRLEETH